MIIQTRYRDIPYEQASSCLHQASSRDRERWESEFRGWPVSIIVPAAPTVSTPLCGGPFFVVPNMTWEGRPIAICPHIAEIGD